MTAITVQQINDLQDLNRDVNLDPNIVLAWPNPARYAVDTLCGAGTYDAIYRYPNVAKITVKQLERASSKEIKLLHSISVHQWAEMLARSHNELAKNNHIKVQGNTAVLTCDEETGTSTVTKVCEVVIGVAGGLAAIIVIVAAIILAVLAVPEVVATLGIAAATGAAIAIGTAIFAIISTIVLGGIALIAEVINIIWG